MLTGSTAALKIRKKFLNELQRPSLSLVQLLRTIFGLISSIVSGKKGLREENNPNFRNLVLNHGVESLDKQKRMRGEQCSHTQRSRCWSTLRAIVHGFHAENKQ